MAVFLPVLVALLTCAALQGPVTMVAAFNRYTVGGSSGWNPGVNYSNWENHTRFYVGDWLVFYYQSGGADVLQVNETAYNQCLSDDPIMNYSKGRSFAFELNYTGHFYFICSRGYCYNGMKLHIKAEKVPPPSPPPSSSHRSAAAGPLRSLSSSVLLPRALATAAAILGALLRSI